MSASRDSLCLKDVGEGMSDVKQILLDAKRESEMLDWKMYTFQDKLKEIKVEI